MAFFLFFCLLFFDEMKVVTGPVGGILLELFIKYIKEIMTLMVCIAGITVLGMIFIDTSQYNLE